MIRVLALSIIFCVFTFVVLIGTAFVVGHGQPPSVAVQQLHLLDCALPCWIGIVPGETNPDEALRHFEEVFGLSQGYNILSPTSNFLAYLELPAASVNSHSRIILVYVEASTEVAEGTVGRTTIEVNNDLENAVGMPSIGDIVGLVGMPSCISPSSSSLSSWWFHFYTPTSAIEVGIYGKTHITWTEPIALIIIRLPDPRFSDEFCPSSFYPWRGLHRNRYSESS